MNQQIEITWKRPEQQRYYIRHKKEVSERMKRYAIEN